VVFISFPAGYKGWVRMSVSTFKCITVGASDTVMSNKYICNLNILMSTKFEDNRTVNANNPVIMYMDDFTIGGSNLNVVNN
jgi:hypothetical protein